ncbi:MAG: hypothetical protein MJ070_07560 [Lachnospiraceae bacterium]|nr:hypothetical protein [Lachnospiraceae bacterium]
MEQNEKSGFALLSGIRDDLIEESEKETGAAKKSLTFKWAAAIAACLVLIVCALPIAGMLKKSTENPEKEFVYYNFYDGSVGATFPVFYTLDFITETSSQLIECEVLSLDDWYLLKDMGDFVFTYSVRVNRIVYDSAGSIRVGDTIRVQSSEGMLPASEAREWYAEAEAKYGTPFPEDAEYGEHQYMAQASLSFPIEVGKTYLMFLDDPYVESDGVYAETGEYLLYLIEDGKVYVGDPNGNPEPVLSDQTYEELLTELTAHAEKRTGLADEIGFYPYRALVEQGKVMPGKAEE